MPKRHSGTMDSDNSAYIESLYKDYVRDPESVAENWKHYFMGLEASSPGRPESLGVGPEASGGKLGGAFRLINAYRTLGHLAGKVDPLSLNDTEIPIRLRRADSGLTDDDSDLEIRVDTLDGDMPMPLGQVEQILSQVYCGSLTSEYYHLSSALEREWLRSRLEETRGEWSLQHTSQQREAALSHVVSAEGMEKYLHRHYTGQKRFSLEGCEALIPLLKQVIEEGSQQGVKDIVVGMAHRGRLNVLVNILGKSPDDLFSEFEGSENKNLLSGSGDVKYHQGFYSNLETSAGDIHVALAFNPSHLEIVYPVVQGGVRARQDRFDEVHESRASVMPLVIHGDAAFSGQGVVTETLNLSSTPGYGTGGTLHIVVNNQIGFTTSKVAEARSTTYCTDVAKVIEAPIFHVNANDIDAVLSAARLALAFRNTFHKDAVIDLVGYRRHGHNEADEPMLTQPMMYRVIKKTPSVTNIYADTLQRDGLIGEADLEQLQDVYSSRLSHGKSVVENLIQGTYTNYAADWNPYLEARADDPVETLVGPTDLERLTQGLTTLPEDFVPHRRVSSMLSDRKAMGHGEKRLDWGMAESLAYASLVKEGVGVRISGQDCERGTFSHRHAVIHHQERFGTYIPLRHIAEHQAKFEAINSTLSELAVLGFEYGYATSSPNALVIWEAQFGDFANMAQGVIDQFISSGLSKWGRLCQLTLFLPHGYEGQGPEHSSARAERFLQLCANQNMRVWVPTTPAQIFHLLRNQAKRLFRRPLVVMMPKSLLRHPLSTSDLSELSEGGLQCVLADDDQLPNEQVERVVLCSGKVYFDLLQARREQDKQRVALVRVEQLYPFPREEVAEQLKQYPNASEIAWCQEEPRNQGAWYQIQHHLQALSRSKQKLAYVGKSRSASTACGIAQMHKMQQSELVNTALGEAKLKDFGYRLEDY